MIILVGIGCFILGGIVGVITMGLCVASSNSRGGAGEQTKGG